MSERQVEIAIDAMGGENSPYKVLKGTEIFLQKEKKTKVVFFGNEEQISLIIKRVSVSFFKISIEKINRLPSFKIGLYLYKFSPNIVNSN